MVSFNCDGCGDVITKGKIKAHAGRCRIGSMSCLDCSTTFRFPSAELDAHTQCISEAQKYQGKLYNKKGDKRPNKKLKPEEPAPVVESAATAGAPSADHSAAPVVVVPESQPDATLAISFADLEALGVGGKKRLRLAAAVDAVLSSAAHRARVEAAVVDTLQRASTRGAVRFDGRRVKPANK